VQQNFDQCHQQLIDLLANCQCEEIWSSAEAGAEAGACEMASVSLAVTMSSTAASAASETSFPPPPRLHTLSSTTWYTHSKRHQKMYHKAHLWRWVWSKLHHLADGISAYAYLIYQHDMYCEDLRRLQGGSTWN
jgi:hypothetical protein